MPPSPISHSLAELFRCPFKIPSDRCTDSWKARSVGWRSVLFSVFGFHISTFSKKCFKSRANIYLHVITERKIAHKKLTANLLPSKKNFLLYPIIDKSSVQICARLAIPSSSCFILRNFSFSGLQTSQLLVSSGVSYLLVCSGMEHRFPLFLH